MPLVVAHRGSSADYPENTLPAFEAAVREGADVVELDVRITADGVPVVLHDLEVASTTDGGGFVHTMTLAEVKRLDASARSGTEVARSEVPTLREAFEVLAGKVGLDLEIKNMPGEPAFDWPKEAAAEAIVKLLDEFDAHDRSLVSSFNWLSIERVRELDPRVETGFLTVAAIDPGAALVYAASRGHRYVLPQVPALLEAGEAFVRRAHDQGIRVGTWTADDPELILRLFEMGTDAVATNRPGDAVAIRDRFLSGSVPQ